MWNLSLGTLPTTLHTSQSGWLWMPHRMSWTRLCQSQTDTYNSTFKKYIFETSLGRWIGWPFHSICLGSAQPRPVSPVHSSHIFLGKQLYPISKNNLKLPPFKTHSLHSLFSLWRPQIDLLIPDAGDVNNSTGVETWILSPVSRSRSSLQSGLFWFSGWTSLAAAHTHRNSNTVILLRVSRLVSGFEAGDLWLPTHSVVIAGQQLNQVFFLNSL